MSHFFLLIGWNICLVIPLAVFAWCACQIRAVRLRPALCHGIWLLVLLKLITPPLLSVPVLPDWHVFDLDVDVDDTPWAARASAVPTRSAFHQDAVIPQASDLFRIVDSKREQAGLANGAESGELSFATEDPVRLSPQQKEAPQESDQRTVFHWRKLLGGFVALSLLVTLGFWVAAIRQIQRVQRLLRHSFNDMAHNGERGKGKEWHARQLLADVSQRFGELRGAPKLALVQAAVPPMVWADPIARAKERGACVILSETLIDSLDDEQLRYVIAHELAHCARRDHWTNMVGFCIATLFWWHPVGWFARRELSCAAEACCDAMVVEKLAGSRKSYAQTLLKVVDFIQSHQLPQPTLALTFGRASSLKKRVQMLASKGVESRVSRNGIWFLMMLGLATLALLPARANEKPRPPQTLGLAEGQNDSKGLTSNSQPSGSEAGLTLAFPAVEGSNTDEVQTGAVPSEKAKNDGAFEKGKYYVVGSVVEEGSKQPIAGASLFFLIFGEPNPDKNVLHASTDEKGRFRAEVPVGSLQLWCPELRAGYWLNPDENTKELVTSAGKPVATLDLKVRRGPAWPVQVTVEGGTPENTELRVSVHEIEDDDARAKFLKGEPVSSMKPGASIKTTLDKGGRGKFTQCGTSGKFVLSVEGDFRTGGIPEVSPITAEFIVDPAFDITKVKTVNPGRDTDKVEVIDERGAKATIANAQVTLTNGLPLFKFHLPRSKYVIQEFAGRVDDTTGKPIADVRVGMLAGVKGEGSGEWPITAMTNAEGIFLLRVPHIESNRELFLSFNFNKDGFACMDSQEFPFPKKPVAAINVGKFTLKTGRWLPIRVVDQEDRPVEGAVVEPVNNNGIYSNGLRRMAIRTDAEGRGILKNLPVGMVSVGLMYPGHNDNRGLVVSSLQADNRETKLRLKKMLDLSAFAAKPREAIAIGQPAPELEIETWTDGKHHKLADYRGRVVVIYYWMITYGSFLRSIPMRQELAEKYKSRGVVFLGVHTPDGDLDQIRKLKKEMGWKTEIGIDRGSSVIDGKTAALYGLRPFHSYIVIDQEGMVASNGGRGRQDKDALLKEKQQLAESLQIPWPLPEDENDEARSYINKFNGAVLSREIDKVLSSGKK